MLMQQHHLRDNSKWLEETLDRIIYTEMTQPSRITKIERNYLQNQGGI